MDSYQYFWISPLKYGTPREKINRGRKPMKSSILITKPNAPSAMQRGRPARSAVAPTPLPVAEEAITPAPKEQGRPAR